MYKTQHSPQNCKLLVNIKNNVHLYSTVDRSLALQWYYPFVHYENFNSLCTSMILYTKVYKAHEKL